MIFQNYEMQLDDLADSQSVGESIQLGMFPFRLRRVDVSVDYDIDFNRYRVHGEAILLNRSRIAYTIPLDRDDLLDYPQKAMGDVCLAFTHAFRNRVDWGIPSNIKLGED